MSLETFWRKQIIKNAEPFHLQDDVTETYDKLVQTLEPEQAAFQACYEWDILLTDEKMKRILKHSDHNLPQETIDWGFDQLENFLETTQLPFCAHTFRLPDNLPDAENALYGPLAGDLPILESEVTYQQRGNRPWTDRLISKPLRFTRQLTIIGKAIEGDLVAFTMHGGPLADKNPEDPTNTNPEQSRKFWSEHALARG